MFSASGVGAGATPAIVLALIVLLMLIRWSGQRIMEVSMTQKMTEKSSSSTVKRFTYLVLTAVAFFFETTWAVGASAVAATVSPLPTHQRGGY